jgi:isopenicillin N synthase-like dioxygenase
VLDSLDPTKAVAEADVKESFYVSLSVLSDPPSSKCSPQTLPPTLLARRENHLALRGLLQHCRRVCEALLDAFERALQLEEGSFKERHLGGEDDRMRLICYPAQHASTGSPNGQSEQHQQQQPTRSGIRAGAHSDYGSLTLLAQSEIGGLQVRDQTSKAGEEQWLDVPPREGALVVNIGDCLEFWSRGLLPSTVHRVVEPRVDAERAARYSM